MTKKVALIHHLRYLSNKTALSLMHSNLRHKLGHAYLIPSDNVIVLD